MDTGIDIGRFRHDGLVREMLAFHAELTAQRAVAEAAARTPEPEDDGGDGGARAILGRLEDVLKARAEEARRRSSEREATVLREAQYVMCALADDLFLHEVEWKGAEAWGADLLERRVFGTRVAGERFFDNVQRLTRVRGRAEAELAPVYLLALGLGFKGRFRAEEHAATIERHASALYEMVAGRPADPAMPGRPLVPAGVRNVVQGSGQRRPVPRVSWPLVTAGIVAAFLVASTALWFAGTAELSAAADAVIRAAR